MADLLITHIKGLVQVREQGAGPVAGAAMGELPVLADAYLAMENGRISAFGPMHTLPPSLKAKETLMATGKFVFPSFVDSHTHLVYAAPREEEFLMKLKGATYAEIAAKGGGILNSAARLQAMPEEELFQRSVVRAREIIAGGTGAVEIKSGYGLTVADELKMLRVARRIGRETPLSVATTFLGAHAVPKNHTKASYLKLVIDEMIPAVASEGLADYIDVFCEEGFFSVEDTLQVAEAGKKQGMRPRIHANQLHRSGGVQAGVQCGAISVDHLENIGDEEIEILKDCGTMPTALPGAAFFLNLPMPPARQMIAAGLPLAIASDYNPGSSPSGNMHLMVALACIRMKMTPEEAINAATLNTAYAMDRLEEHGSITVGKRANVFITRPMPSVAYFPYAYGANLVETVILGGRVIRDE